MRGTWSSVFYLVGLIGVTLYATSHFAKRVEMARAGREPSTLPSTPMDAQLADAVGLLPDVYHGMSSQEFYDLLETYGAEGRAWYARFEIADLILSLLGGVLVVALASLSYSLPRWFARPLFLLAALAAGAVIAADTLLENGITLIALWRHPHRVAEPLWRVRSLGSQLKFAVHPLLLLLVPFTICAALIAQCVRWLRPEHKRAPDSAPRQRH